MPKFTSLDELCSHEIDDLMSAEKQLVKALPKIIKATSSADLKSALESHLEETKTQIERLEQASQLLGHTVKSHKCKGMEGLIEEADEFLENGDNHDPGVLDAGLIGACQRVEHYEIAGYGTLVAHLNLIGAEEASTLLAESLEEEKKADEALTEIAEGVVNVSAPAGETETGSRGRRSRDD